MAFLSLTRGNTHVLNQNDFNEGYGVEGYLALIEPPFSYYSIQPLQGWVNPKFSYHRILSK